MVDRMRCSTVINRNTFRASGTATVNFLRVVMYTKIIQCLQKFYSLEYRFCSRVITQLMPRFRKIILTAVKHEFDLQTVILSELFYYYNIRARTRKDALCKVVLNLKLSTNKITFFFSYNRREPYSADTSFITRTRLLYLYIPYLYFYYFYIFILLD